MILYPYKIVALRRIDEDNENILPYANFDVRYDNMSLSPVYSNSSGSPFPTPFQCDANGEANIWLNQGRYKIKVGNGDYFDVYIGDDYSAISEALDISGKEEKSNKSQDLLSPSAITYPSTLAVASAIADVQVGYIYKGTWDSQANSPYLESGVGEQGERYVVDVGSEGSTELDGNSLWSVGDSVVFSAGAWRKVPVISELTVALALKANIDSPALTGNPTAPTPDADDDSQSIATTEYVQGELSDRVQSVATISDLRALTGLTPGQKIKVSGYYAGSLKGGGDFTVSSDAVTADNGVTVFVTTDSVRVYRDYVGVLTPFMAGAIGDGTTDDTAAFNALDAINDIDIYVPNATYILNGATLTGKKMYGNGTLKWLGGVDGTIALITLNYQASISGITIDGNKSANSSITIALRSTVFVQGANVEISKCYFVNHPATIILGAIWNGAGNTDNASNVTISKCLFKNSSRAGIIARSNNWKFLGCSFFGTGIIDGHCIRFGRFNSDPNVITHGGIVEGCEFKFINSLGVLCEMGSAEVVVSGCNFSYCYGFVKVEYQPGEEATDILFIGNRIDHCRYNIIYDEGTETVTLGTTEISAASMSGFRCSAVGNLLYEASGFTGSGGTLLDSNQFIDCGSPGIGYVVAKNTNDSTEMVVSNNTFRMDAARSLNQVIAANQPCLGVYDNKFYDCDSVTNVLYGSGSDVKFKRNEVIGNANTGFRIANAGVRCEVVDNNFGSTTTPLTITVNDLTPVVMRNYSYGTVSIEYNPIIAIASGALTVSPNTTRFRCATEGGAASDDLDTINGGRIGQVITISTANSAQDPTVKNATGNIRLSGGDYLIGASGNALVLMCTGSFWVELGRY